MSTKVIGSYVIGQYVSSIYPEHKCTTCPFFHDEMVGWCGWHKEKIDTPEFNEKCSVKRISVEEGR